MNQSRLLVPAAVAALGAVSLMCAASILKSDSKDSGSFGLIYPLAIDRSTLDFGEVYLNKAYRCRISIENRSRSKIDVADVVIGCSCVKAEPQSFEMLPGQSELVELTIDLSRSSPSTIIEKKNGDDDGVQMVESKLPIVIKGKKGRPLSEVAILRGKVLFPVSLSRRSVLFAGSSELLVGQKPATKTVRIYEKVDAENLRLDYDHTEISISQQSIGELGMHTLAVTPIISNDKRVLQSDIGVHLSFKSGLEASFDIPVRGDIVYSVGAVPSLISHSTEHLSTSPVVSLTSRAGSEFAVNGFEWVVENSTLNVVAKSLDDQSRAKKYRLEFLSIPVRPGIYKGKFVFKIEEFISDSQDKPLSYLIPVKVLLAVKPGTVNQ